MRACRSPAEPRVVANLKRAIAFFPVKNFGIHKWSRTNRRPLHPSPSPPSPTSIEQVLSTPCHFGLRLLRLSAWLLSVNFGTAYHVSNSKSLLILNASCGCHSAAITKTSFRCGSERDKLSFGSDIRAVVTETRADPALDRSGTLPRLRDLPSELWFVVVVPTLSASSCFLAA